MALSMLLRFFVSRFRCDMSRCLEYLVRGEREGAAKVRKRRKRERESEGRKRQQQIDTNSKGVLGWGSDERRIRTLSVSTHTCA